MGLPQGPDASELRFTLSSEWKTSEFLKAKMDQARGPEAYAKTICRPQKLSETSSTLVSAMTHAVSVQAHEYSLFWCPDSRSTEPHLVEESAVWKHQQV